MVERKAGTVFYWQNLSPVLSIFRFRPALGGRFPDYQAGQYIALRREDCKLTKAVVGPDGQVQYLPDLDEHGRQKRGPITHSYSISSAPSETQSKGYIECYVILETDEDGNPGRLTESLFRIDPEGDNQVTYFYRIAGDFTLQKRALDFQRVLLVGTGTGLAPFVSMIKQLHHECSQGKADSVQYTLLHTNRTLAELAYHEELMGIEASHKFDFVYIPSVSRPTSSDFNDPRMGKGRANNLLRSIFEMPLKEQQMLDEATQQGKDASIAQMALNKAVPPELPRHLSRKVLRERFDPSHTVILTCGNPLAMADIQLIAEANRIPFEKEDW
jgi:ferredoxin-NADP reductase